MPADESTLDELERIVDGAGLWGLELDTRYRVLAATFEVGPDAHPRGEVEDLRLQVLFHPVNTVLGSLRRTGDDGTVHVEAFTVDQLVDVVAGFDGAGVHAPLFGAAEPAPGQWAPEWSLEGRAQVIDGKTHSVTVHLEGAAGRAFDFYATFDDVVVRDPTGDEIPIGAQRG